MSSKKEFRIQKMLPIVLPTAIFLTLFILSKYKVAGFEQIGYAIGYYGWKALRFVMGAF
ncbi:Uncharacterised protein [Porphyromonas cangingivalis]|uniref:Uncharacterized protein n=1 Tax=Porphyromonas cangingivalis TaxID=36874 RepID=A0A1T4JSC9_PORCN|nr:hypothetical protein SAMN02745205_00342 [Porphyromonas cangingivalis]VEJ04694.1 Uncharacterised protein [Porphyromonas cangingivalis]